VKIFRAPTYGEYFVHKFFDILSKAYEEIGLAGVGYTPTHTQCFTLFEQSPYGTTGYTCRQTIGVFAVTSSPTGEAFVYSFIFIQITYRSVCQPTFSKLTHVM